MRVILTWIVAIALTCVLGSIWYLSQPLIVYTISVVQPISETSIAGYDWNTVGSGQMYTFLTLAANIGIPLIVVFIWVWAIVSSQAQQWRGEESVYG